MSDDRFPEIPSEGTDAFRGSPHSIDFIWKVYGTTCRQHIPNVHGSWDHLTFAFYCPTSNLDIQPQLCSIVEKYADKYRPRSRENSQERNPEDRFPDQHIIAHLKRKIQSA